MTTQCRFNKESWQDFTEEENEQIAQERRYNHSVRANMTTTTSQGVLYGKKCPACEKPNSLAITKCTQCLFELTDDDIHPIPSNVFMDVIQGKNTDTKIAQMDATVVLLKDRFRVSQFESYHLDAIPREIVIEDISHLTKEHIPLVELLYETGVNYLKQNTDFCERVKHSDVEKYLIAGFNYPVSVKHLHLHLILPPLKHEGGFQYPRWNSYEKVLSDLKTYGHVRLYSHFPDEKQGELVRLSAIEKHRTVCKQMSI